MSGERAGAFEHSDFWEIYNEIATPNNVANIYELLFLFLLRLLLGFFAFFVKNKRF